MKKSLFIAIALTAILTGCVKDELRNPQGDVIDVNAPVFHAGFADKSPDTKTYLNEGGHLRWNADDRLTIFVGKTLNTEFAFDGEDGDNAGEFLQVSSGSSFVTANPLDANYAVYPYSKSTKISEEGVISLSLPEVQAYGEDSFGRGANTMVAVTENKDDYFLPFKNVCGYLVVSLYGDVTITSVSLTGNNGEKIAGAASVTPSFGGSPSVVMNDSATGTVTIDCGDGIELGTTKETATAFWFCIPQTSFSKGFTITATADDGTGFQKSTSKTISIERNKIYSMAALQYEANYGNVEFEDANFKAYCVENFDTDGDGEISFTEAATVINMDFYTDNIKSIEGIRYFTNLQSLKANGSGAIYGAKGGGGYMTGNYSDIEWPESRGLVAKGQLEKVDFSGMQNLQVIYVEANNLKEINLAGCSGLTSISCGFSLLKEIELIDCKKARYLNISWGLLESLDVSYNTELSIMYCVCNLLTSLDVSNNTSLQELCCEENPLTLLDVSKNTTLKHLTCDGTNLTSLIVGKNTVLTNLSCAGCLLKSLDVSGCTALNYLWCNSNQLSTINVSGCTALTKLYCTNNQLTSLDVSKNTALTDLWCFENQLTNLDVSGCKALTDLACYSNQLTNLDVSDCTTLTKLSCSYNQLTSLDLSGCKALTSLGCSDNQLTSLDISKNTALKSLNCSNNQLTSLDVSNNTALTFLGCAPMSTLETLYITQDQSIPNITSNRSSSYIPATTDIVIAGVPQAVDLGLSVKWASINLGADAPWESGGFYSWGETTPKSVSECNYANYKYAENNGGWKFTKYCTNSFRGTVDNKTRLELADDAAYAELGGSWRIPTKDDWNELVANCTFTYTTMNGIPGYEVRSNKTGYTSNYIFMPISGQYYSSSHYYEGKMGVYWSSDLVSNDDNDGYVIEIISPEAQYSGHKELHAGPREGGCTIRPVCN